jgi:hypothetical protein
MNFRVCRDCGAEYRPEIARCSDCGGALEDRYEDESGESSIPPLADEPPAPTLNPESVELRPIFSSPAAADVEPMAERLGGARIPFAVRVNNQNFELVVNKDDIDRALDLLGLRTEGGAEESCPACGVTLAPHAAECPDCGLAMAPPPEA